jgi:ABC-type Co2+ transport system permease subunit
LIAGVGGAVLLVSMLLPWYTRETEVAGALFSESWNAWESLSLIAVALFAIAVVAIAVPVASAARPDGRGGRLLWRLGLVAAALVLFRMIDIPIATADTLPGDRADLGRGAGLLLALLASAAIAYGGRLAR